MGKEMILDCGPWIRYVFSEAVKMYRTSRKHSEGHIELRMSF